ncbi:MAG TPA: dihydrofolate reductase [Gammaproteobacteria bacterium]|jgi:dihydrofolate reductase|nr:dihydrofolate reductase [Gammaproteobacteria bacterium]
MSVIPTSPIIAAIVAMAENRVIGHHNQLPWRLPADLKHFKTLTMGCPVLMGRKTYASIGRPLPGRLNVVITRDPAFKAEGCVVVTSLIDAIKRASLAQEVKTIFIIGGAEIYQQALPLLQRIYLTVIHHLFDGDAFFPELDKGEWQEAACERHAADEQNPYDYSFVTLERVGSN